MGFYFVLESSATFEGASVADYRLYCLDEGERIANAHQIEAESDDDAIAQAQAMKLPVKCELWNRDRLVTVLPARVSAS